MIRIWKLCAVRFSRIIACGWRSKVLELIGRSKENNFPVTRSPGE